MGKAALKMLPSAPAADQQYMIVDFETKSLVDLTVVGAFEYASHPSTSILCTGWKIGTRQHLGETKVCEDVSVEFLGALLDPTIHLVAHNVFFELSIIMQVLAPRLPPELADALKQIPLSRWTCTAAMSRRMGLPGKLEKVGAALNLPVQKDMIGHEVMLRLSRGGEPEVGDMESLLLYCADDIETEALVFQTLPQLDAYERAIWEADIRMNMRGFLVDRSLITNSILGASRIKGWCDNEFKKAVGSAGGKKDLNSARQGKRLLAYLQERGYDLPNFRAITVANCLRETGTPDWVRKLLQLRQIAAKSSIAKFLIFEQVSRFDGRIRDTLLYYGAHTGRQAAMGAQPQNIPNQDKTLSDEEISLGIELILNRRFDDIQLMFENPNLLYASVLKPAIIAEPGKEFHHADFSTIEVRVLFWLAGELKGLQAIRDGRDLYIEMASRIYNISVHDLTIAREAGEAWANQMRQLGKQTVLGAGFGIGVGGIAFQRSCRNYGLEIALPLAAKAVVTYRNAFPAVVAYWYAVEKAAIAAMQHFGKAFKVGRLRYVGVKDKEGRKFLRLILPSGRSMFYFSPEILYQRHGHEAKPTLTFLTYNRELGKMVRESTWGGKLVQNATQAAARDITMEAIVKLDREGFDPILAVHDAIITETDIGREDSPFDLIKENPTWCPEIPIGIEYYTQERYG
jgi:DNA polymerase